MVCRTYSSKAVYDSVTELADRLRQCTKSKSLLQGKQIHASIVQHKLIDSTYLANLLIQMYGNCRDLDNAILVFTNMTDRNVFSWNIMITAYAQNGHYIVAEKYFNWMPSRDPVSWNLIITTYAQKGRVQEAREMFDRTPDHDTVTWNAMIAAYAQNGYLYQALGLFRLMQIEGVAADRITFTSTIDACSDFPEQGRILHAEIITSGIKLDRKVHNSMINMYGKAGLTEGAKLVFNSMQDRDVVSWTALMMTYSQFRHLQEARKVFDRMPQRDTMAWNALIIDYARFGKLEKAMELYAFLPEENPVSSTTMITANAQNGFLLEARSVFDNLVYQDVVTWNAIIAAYVQQGEFKEALRLFQDMVVYGADPNRITFISSLHACARVAVLDAGKAIHEEIVIREMIWDVTLITMLINMYGRCGQLVRARKLFEEHIELSMLLWNTMLAAYAQNGHHKESMELFREMSQAGVEPDEVSFIILLSACSHSGLLRDAREYFHCMVGDHGFAPIKDHYGCMIDLMGRTGQLEKAEDLIINMPYEPDIVTWTSLVGACRVHKDPKRGLRISKLALASDPSSSSPYALLSNIYVGND